MKKIMYFMLPTCPYCHQANRWMKEILAEYPQYKEIEIQIINEFTKRKLAYSYDYYLVPSYYIDEQKVHEGIASKDIIRKVFEMAYNK